MKYARIQDGIVVEIITPFVRTEEMRPPLPVIEEGEEPTEAQLLQQQAHENFVVGPQPIEELYHPDFIAALVEIPDGIEVEGGDSYADGVFGPPPVYVPTEAEVLRERDSLLALATSRIAPLQDAVDLGEATAEEEAQLLAWKQYRVKLNRINTQPGFPASVDWPVQPT